MGVGGMSWGGPDDTWARIAGDAQKVTLKQKHILNTGSQIGESATNI